MDSATGLGPSALQNCRVQEVANSRVQQAPEGQTVSESAGGRFRVLSMEAGIREQRERRGTERWGKPKTLRREKEAEWTQEEAVCKGSGSVPEPLKEKGSLEVSCHS